MGDNFKNYARGTTAPASLHAPIIPSDNADLENVPRAIYCLAAGTAALRDKNGTDVTYTLTVGQVLTFRPTRILATGTSATLVAWE